MSDAAKLMATPGFKAENAEGYEGIMGRWSRRLAPLLIRHGGLADGDQVLDVGCGTGSLTFILPTHADVAGVIGIDPSAAYVAYAAERNTDPRISFRTGDARELPFADGGFDRVFCQLVLQFIPESRKAMEELVRVAKPGGMVAAAVWDSFGGGTSFRMLKDIASVTDPDSRFGSHYFSALNGIGELAAMFAAVGLEAVEPADLLIRMDYASFDDYWTPFEAGDGPPGQYIMGLTPGARAIFKEHARKTFLGGRSDGPRSFTAIALACRGRKRG